MHATMKLGKLPPRHDPRTFQMARYLTLAPAPAACDWTRHVPMPCGMALNDQLGDCTCAAAAHMIQVWTANAGKQVNVTDAAVLKAYRAVSGYDPKDPSTDNGAVMLDVLNYWRKTGLGGHKIGAFVQNSPKNHDHVTASIALFGGVYVGLALPLSAQTQTIWDVPKGGLKGRGAPGSWGGHCIGVATYDPKWPEGITWGNTMRMTWAFFYAYCDESYALLAKEWLGTSGKSPSGFDMATLQADLKQLAN